MRAVRKINNNAAVYADGKGRELVALGRGIGFGQLPREVALADITRTFYRVDAKYLDLTQEEQLYLMLHVNRISERVGVRG